MKPIPALSYACMAMLLSGCLQGLENHSRFDKMTPKLLRYAQDGDIKAIKLYYKSGGNLNITNKVGFTALMETAVNDDVEVAKYLLAHGANPWLRNNAGYTALDVSKFGKPNRVTSLLQNSMLDLQKGKK